MPKKTTYTKVDDIHDIHHRASVLKDKLDHNDWVLERNERIHRKSLKEIERMQAKAKKEAERAKEYRAKGKHRRAERTEYQLRKLLDSIARMEAKAKDRRDERMEKALKRRKGLKWALGTTMALTAMVAAGVAVAAPNPHRPLEEPANVAIPPAPPLDGEAAAPEPAPADPADRADDGAPGDGDDQAAADEPVDDSTGIHLHALYIGNGAGLKIEHLGGVPYTLTRVGGEDETTISGHSIGTEEGLFQPLEPGTYELRFDDSGFNTILCRGQYVEVFTIEAGDQATGTGFFKDQTNGNGNSFGRNCIEVRVP